MPYHKKTSYFYKIDFLTSPPTFTLNSKDNHKTAWGALISVLSLLVSFIFIIYNLIKYIKHKEPLLIFSKDGSMDKHISIDIAESLFLLKIADSYTFDPINETNAFLSATLITEFYKGGTETKNLNFSKCKLGKNINMKFKNTISKIEIIQKESYQNYYCLSKGQNVTIFYNPDVGHSYLNIKINSRNNSLYLPTDLRAFYLIENDAIDHYNKKNPITPYYLNGYTQNYQIDSYISHEIFLEYIEYLSDDSLLFTNNKLFKGFGLKETHNNIYQAVDKHYNYRNDLKVKGYTTIGDIKLRISRKNYEYYIRSYQKLISLYADLESTVNLIIVLGGLITNFISEKNSKVDIVKSIITKKTGTETRKYMSYKQHHSFYELFKDKNMNNINNINNNLNNKINKYDILNKSSDDINYSSRKPSLENMNINNNKKRLNMMIKIISEKNMEKNRINIKKIEKINIWTIFKSYFCCNDPNIKLVDSCCEFVEKELRVERILKRIFKLERMYYLMSDIERLKILFIDNMELTKINDCLEKIKLKENEKENNEKQKYCETEIIQNKNIDNEKFDDKKTNLRRSKESFITICNSESERT